MELSTSLPQLQGFGRRRVTTLPSRRCRSSPRWRGRTNVASATTVRRRTVVLAPAVRICQDLVARPGKMKQACKLRKCLASASTVSNTSLASSVSAVGQSSSSLLNATVAPPNTKKRIMASFPSSQEGWQEGCNEKSRGGLLHHESGKFSWCS